MALELDDNDVGMAAPSATKGLFDIGEEEMSDQDVLDILRSNEKKNFVKRILYPEKSLVLDIGDNGEGTIATHKMSYSTIDNGNAVVYPTVVQQGEELVELDPRKAYDYAIKSGEFIVMPEKKAELFTKNYKKAWSIGDENSDSAILARLVETEAPKPRDDSLIGFIPSGNEINYDEETARQLPGNDPQRAREIAAAINRTNAKPSDEPSTFDVATSSVAKSGAKLFGDYPAALYHLMFGSGKEIATQPELETVVSEAQKTPDDLRSRMILESNARQSDVSANEAAKEAASVAIDGPRADTAVSKYVYRIMNENKPAEININSADSENNVFASEKNFTKWYGDKMREIKRRADETLSKAGELTLDNGLFTKKNLDALPKVIASQMGFVLESTLLSILAGGPLEGFAKAGDIVKNSKLGLHVAKMAVGGSKGAAALNKLLPYAADSLVGAVPSAINETHDIALEAYNAVKKRGGTEEESNAAYYDSFGKAFAATLGTEALQYYINFKSMNKLKPIKSPVGADSDTMDNLAKSVFKSATNMASAAVRDFLPQLGQEVMQDYSVAKYTGTNVFDPKYIINTMAGVIGQSGAVAAATTPIRMAGPQVADTSTTSQLERNYVYDSAKRTYESVLRDREELDKLTQEEDSLRGLRGAPDQGIVPGIAPSIDEAARNEKGELVNKNASRLEQIKSRKNDLVRNIADNSEFADRFAPWADNESATDEATFGKFASEVYGEDALEPMLRSVRTDNGKLILTINEAIKKRENITNAIKESEKLYSSTLSQLSDESKNAIIKDARDAYDSITKEIEQTENEEDKRQLIQVQDELRYALAGTRNEETNSFDVNTTHLLKILMDMSENGDDYISSLKNREDVSKVLESVTASDAIVSSMLKKEDRAVLRDAAIKSANESEDSDMKRLIMNAVQREDYSTLVHLLGANTGVNSAVMGRIEAGDEAVSLITNPDGTQSYVKQVGTDEKGNPLYSKASPVDSSVVASSAGIRAGDRVSVEGEKDRTYVFRGIENGMATLLEVDNKGRVSEQPKLSVPVARLRKSDRRMPVKGVNAATGNTVITEDVRGADSEGNITTSKGDVIVSPKPVVPDRTVGNPYKYYGSEVAFSGEQSDAPIEPEQNVEAKQEEKSENAAENNDIIRAGDSVTYQWDGKEYYFDGVTAASGNAVIREVGDDGRPTGKGILVPMSSISKRAVEPVRETAAMPPAVPVAAPEPVQAPSNASSENIPETEASARATGREGKKYEDDIEELRDIMLETRNPIKMEALLVMADNIGSIRSPRTSREDIESKVISDLSKRTGRDKDSTVIADAAAWAMDLYDSFQNRPERGLSLTSDIINKVYDATAKEYAGQGYAGNKFKYDMKLLLGLMPNRMMSKVNSIVLPFMGSGASGIIAQKRLWSNGNRNVSVFASDLNPAIVKAMNAMKDNPAAVQVEINGIMHKMSIILTKFYENEYTAEEDNMDHEARIKRVTAREAAFVALSQLWNKYNDSGNKLSAAEEAAWFVIANDGSIGMNGGGWGNTSGSVTGKDVHVGEPRYPRAQKLLVTDDAQQNTGSSHFIPQRISDGIIIRDASSKSRNSAIVRKSINALAVTMRNRVNNTSEAIRDWTIVHESAEDTLARVGKSGKNGLPEHSLIMLDPPYVPTETQEASGGTSLRYSGAEDTGIMSNEGAAEFINKKVAPLAKNNYVIIHNNASPRLIELAKQSGLDYRIVNNVGRTTWKGKEGEKSGVSGNRNEVVFYNTLSKLPGDENKKYTGKVKQSDTNYEERRNNSIAQQERIDNAYGSMNAMLSVDGGKSSEELRSYMSDDLFMDDIVDPELTDEQRAIVDFVESNGAIVQFFDGPSELNGFIRSNPVTHNSTIFININKEARGFEFTIWHEFTHFLQASHPQSYRELCRALGITDEQFDAFDKNIGEFYGNRYTQLDEVVANAMADTKILNKLSKALQRKPSLLNRIIRAAREFFVSMRNFMTGRRRDVVESSTKESNTTKYLTNDQITEMQGWLISALNHGRPKGSPAVFIGKSGEAHTIDVPSTMRDNNLDAEYIEAVKQGDIDKAQRMVDDAAIKSGLIILDDTESIAYKVRRSSPPKKTITAYKLFTTKRSEPGKLFPLFVGNSDAIPVGVWLDAQAGEESGVSKTGKRKVKSKLGPLAYRPGWHAGDLPIATHIGIKDSNGNVFARRANEVWAEVEVAADIDYQQEADENGRSKNGAVSKPLADIKHIPTDGMYRYKTNPNMTGSWIISGSMKVNRVLTEEEVGSILEENGIDAMPWDGGKLVLENLGLDPNISRAIGKLSDAITYDDNGNIIPLSKRFNAENYDIRYSVNTEGRSSIAERLRRNRGMSDTVVAESGKEKEADNANAQEAPKDESAAKLSKSLGEKISYDTRRKNEFPGVRRASERAYEMMIDELYFLGKTQDQFDKAYASVYGNPPPSAFNAYGKARLVPAEQANAIKDINTLFDILHDVTPEDNDNLLPFLVAQHGIEYYTQLNVDPGLGMTLEELQAIVKNTDKRISDIAGDLRDRYNEIQHNMLVGSGIMSQEKFDEMRKMYPFYVPFLRSGSAGEMSDYISGRLHKHSVTVKDPVRSIVLKGKDNREHRVFNPIQTMIRNIAIFHSAKARNDVSKAVLSMASMEGFESLAVERERGDRDTVTFSVWDNGKRTMYKTDPDIFRALDNLSKTFDTTIIEDIAESINDFFKTMTTRWNPKFGLSNLFRDSFQVALVSKDPLAMPFYNTLIGMSYQIIAKRAAKALEKGDDISDRRKRILAIVTEAFDSGLAYSTIAEAMDNASPENIAKQYKKDHRISMSNAGAFGLLSPLFWAKRKGRAALEKVGRINEMVEIAPKIHEYAYLRNKGVDSMRATITAREVNIDFQRHGYKAKSWNRFVPFLSASLQGVDRVVRAAGASELSKGNYKNAAKDFAIFMLRGFLFITLPSVLIWMYNKDDDDYGDKLRDRKDASWLIPVDVDDSGHSVYLALPKPRELGIMFGSSVERLLNHVYEKDADAFKDLEANFFESITPSVFPQIVRPMIEAYFDHWFFTGRSIIPESKKALPYHMQYSAKTSSLARAVAAGLHNVGIDKALGRFASPYIIDHLIREYTGTLGKDILSTTDYAINMLGVNAPMEKSSMVERPFWRTFFITRSSGSQAVNDFYDTYDDVERLKNGDPERGNKRMFSKFAKARKDLSEMWGDANDVRQDMNMSPEAKRRKLDAIDDMARRKAMSVMREYRRFAERQAAQKD